MLSSGRFCQLLETFKFTFPTNGQPLGVTWLELGVTWRELEVMWRELEVWGFRLEFWMPRCRFSPKSFTSSFIALNFILGHMQMLKSNKVTLFLQLGYTLQANKQLPSLLFLFVEKHWSQLEIQWQQLKWNGYFMILYFFTEKTTRARKLNYRGHFDNFHCIDRMISICSSLLHSKSIYAQKANN